MFGSIKKLFSSNSSEANTKEETIDKSSESLTTFNNKENTSLSFKPELIPSLKSEHQHLLSLYTLIMGFAEKKNYSLLTEVLAEFDCLLKDHLGKEGIELYVGLEFSPNIDDPKIFRDFRREMSNIASIVVKAINKHTKKAVTDETVDQFIKEFSDLGGVLVERIEREESVLYPLYC